MKLRKAGTCPNTGKDLYTLTFKASVVEAMTPSNENIIQKASTSAVETSGILEGYASTFGNPDEVGDIIRKGAFKKSLSERVPRVLWQHDPHAPIGVMKQAYEDDKGLFVTIELNLDTQKGREAFSLYKQGGMDSFSIGAMLEKYEIIENKQTGMASVDAKELRLLEVSAVTFPANEQAVVTSVKGHYQDISTKGEEIILEDIKNAETVDEMIVALQKAKELEEESILALFKPLDRSEDENILASLFASEN